MWSIIHYQLLRQGFEKVEMEMDPRVGWMRVSGRGGVGRDGVVVVGVGWVLVSMCSI